MAAAYFGDGSYGSGAASVIHADSAHSDHIVIADAQFLFTAHFHRAGPDLVLTGADGHKLLIPGYFASEHPPALVAPSGAALSAHLVELLAGSAAPNEYAQAGAAAPPEPIGRVEKTVGEVTVIRNGVAVTLNVGDSVYKSDVVQTGANSSAGVAFPDGSALNLVANTRMALNEYSYDPNSTSNSALFSLVEGGLSFVAGKVAHTGDMKIGTPIATMGIRGTAGWLYEDQVATVTAQAGNVTLHFAAVFDGVTNSQSLYSLYAVDANGNLLHDANGDLIELAQVSSLQGNLVTTLTGNGFGTSPSVSVAPPDVTQQQFFNFVAPQVINIAIEAIQQYQQQQNNQQTNPQSNPGSTGSGTPPGTPSHSDSNPQIEHINLNDGGLPVTITTVVQNTPTTTPPPVQAPQPTTTPAATGPQTFTWNPPAGSSPQPFTNPPDWQSPSPAPVPGPTDNVVDNSPTPILVNGPETIADLTVGTGALVHVVGSSAPGSLTVTGVTSDSGTITSDSTTDDPTITFEQAVTMGPGGIIDAVATGNAAGIIFASGVTMAGGAEVLATGDGASVTFDAGATIAAGAEIEAHGAGASVFITNVTGPVVTNSGLVLAEDGGHVTLFDVQIENAGGIIEATNSLASGSVISLISFSGSDIVGGTLETGDPVSSFGGEIEIGAGLEATFFDGSTGAGPVTVDAFVQVDDGASLDLVGTIINEGEISLAGGATLILSDAVVDGGGGIFDSGNIEVTASSTLDGGTIYGDASALIVDTGVMLTLDDTTLENLAVTNHGMLQLDSGHTLHLSSTTIDGGTVLDNGSIEVSGTVTIDGAIDGKADEGTIVVDSGATLILDRATIENVDITNHGTLQIDADETLTLKSTTLDGGAIVDNGNIEISASSTIDNGAVVQGDVGALTVDAGTTLTLDNAALQSVDVANSGTLQIDPGHTLTLTNATISGGVINDDGALNVDHTTISDATISLGVQDPSLTVLQDPYVGGYSENVGGDFALINNAGQVLGVEHSDAFIYSSSNGTYTEISDPNNHPYYQSFAGLNSDVFAVNDSSEVIGFYTGYFGLADGFTYSNGTYTTLNDPSAGYLDGTIPLAINDAGEIAGIYEDNNNFVHGFIYDDGAYTTLDDPLAVNGTYARAINDSGVIAGNYYDAGDVNHGFIYADGSFITIDDPSARQGGTFVVGMSNAGAVVGYYYDTDGTSHGFVYSDGVYTTLTDPSNSLGTVAQGINDEGEVVGYYLGADASEHGFVYSNGSFTNIDAVPGAYQNNFESINDSGQIAGFYTAGGSVYAFMDTPTTTVLADGTTVNGGTLSIANLDTVEIESGSQGSGATLDHVGVTNQGIIEVGTSSTSDATLTLLEDTSITGGSLMVHAGSTLAIGTDEGPGHGATLDLSAENFGTISASGGAIGTFEAGSFTNESSGQVIATGAGSEISIDAADNFATVEAISGGTVSLTGDLVNETNATVLAKDGGIVDITPTGGENDGTITADDGTVLLDLSNSAHNADDHGNVGTMQAIDGGTLTITDATSQTTGHGATLTNSDTLQAESGGTVLVEVNTENSDGHIAVSGAGSFVDFFLSVTGGDATISDGGKLEYGWFSNVATAFKGDGTLVLDHQDAGDAQAYVGTVSGATAGDVFDLTYNAEQETGFHAQSGDDFRILTSYAHGITTLEVEDKTLDETSAPITLSGNYANPDNFSVTSDGHGGIDLTVLPPPTPDDWTGNADNGQWSDAGNWDNGVPTTNSEVNIAVSGAIVTFDISASPDTIDTLSTNGGTTLDIKAGALTISGADGNSGVEGALGVGGTLDIQNSALALSGSVAVSGLLEATDHGTLDVQTGAIDNSGTDGSGIAIDGTSKFVLDSHDSVQTANNFFLMNVVELSGGGDVAMASGSQITENANDESLVASGAVLYNVDNDVFGAGTIGSADGHLTLYNAADGTIDADASGQTLALETGNAIHNAGLLEATNGGILQIDDQVINSGTLEASSGGILQIDDQVTNFGTLEADGGTLTLGAGFAFSQFSQNDIVMLADGGTLQLGNTGAFTSSGGSISGFGPASVVDLTDVTHMTGEHAIWTQTGDNGTLQVFSGTGALEASLNLNGSYGQTSFALTIDQDGGTEVITNPATVTFSSGFDQSTGNAVEGQALSVNVTDADNGSDLGTITYTWFANGAVVQGDNTNSYTPTAADLDNNSPIDVVVDFTDPATGKIDQVALTTAGTESPPNSGPLTDNFTGAAGNATDWFDSANWSIEVPTASDQAVINPGHPAEIAFPSAVAGSLTVKTDATLSITHGGALDVSTALQNSGAIVVHGWTGSGSVFSSATFTGTVANNGSITVGSTDFASANTATFGGTINNTGGTITVQSNASVMLDGAAVEGGTITSSGTITAAGPVVVEDDAFVAGGTLNIGNGAPSTLDIEAGTGSGATFDHVAVTLGDSGALDIADLGVSAILTLQNGTAVSDSGGGTLNIGTYGELAVEAVAEGNNSPGALLDGVDVENHGKIQVGDSGGVGLALTDGTTIHGGELAIGPVGELDITYGGGASAESMLDDVVVTNAGIINVDPTASGAILMLDDDTSITGGALTVGVSGKLEIGVGSEGSGHGATFDDLAVANAGKIIVDPSVAGATLTLDNSTVDGSGTLQDQGAINAIGAVEIGNAVSDGGSDSGGAFNIESGASLTFDNSVAIGVTVAFAAAAGVLALGDTNAFGATISGFTGADVIDLTDLAYSPNEYLQWDSDNNTLQIWERVDGTPTLERTLNIAGTHTVADFSLAADSAASPGTEILARSPQFWGEVDFPAQTTSGVHLFPSAMAANSFNNVVALFYSSTTDYSPDHASGPYEITRSVLPLDPFFLPQLAGNQVVEPAVDLTLPARNHFILPNILEGDKVQTEGIAVYETQDASNNHVLDLVTVGGSPDDYSPLNVSTPVEIENVGSGTIYNIDEGFRQDSATSGGTPYLSSYSVAWDDYNASSSTYTINFQIFTAGGSTSSSLVTPLTLTGISAPATTGATDLPAWEFRDDGGLYALAFAKHNSTTGQDFIQFLGYNTDGTRNTTDNTKLESFQIQADLSFYTATDAHATNQITQDVVPGLNGFPGGASQQLQFAQLSSTNGNDWVVGWNETITDSGNGTFLGDQVEFAVVQHGSLVDQFTYQLADAQNVRVETVSGGNSGNDYAVLAYGDGTATHLVAFEISNGGTTVTEIGSVTDATTVPYANLVSLGDGRFAIEYDNIVGSNETSQYDLKIFDFRNSGVFVDDSNLTDGQDKYVAGTHYSDFFHGESNANNFYDYVGADTALGSGPSDIFDGGANGWNAAVFSDARSNYKIAAQGDGTVLVTDVGDSAHAGSLTVDGNVEALAFEPTHDPKPHSDGSIEATGGTLVVLTDFGNNATIDAGATLEYFAPVNFGVVTFSGSAGTFQVDQLGGFTGQVAGVQHDDAAQVLDLDGFGAHESDQFAVAAALDDAGNTELTVTDLAPDNQKSEMITLVGDHTGETWAAINDTHGGVDVYDPPAPSPDSTGSNGFLPNDEQITFGPNGAVTYTINSGMTASTATQTESTTVSSNGVVIGEGANDTFVFQPGMGSATVANFNAQQDTLTFDHFSQAETVQELQSLITTDAHGDAIVNLGHNDIVTLTGVTTAQLQQAIQAGHVLLH